MRRLRAQQLCVDDILPDRLLCHACQQLSGLWWRSLQAACSATGLAPGLTVLLLQENFSSPIDRRADFYRQKAREEAEQSQEAALGRPQRPPQPLANLPNSLTVLRVALVPVLVSPGCKGTGKRGCLLYSGGFRRQCCSSAVPPQHHWRLLSSSHWQPSQTLWTAGWQERWAARLLCSMLVFLPAHRLTRPRCAAAHHVRLWSLPGPCGRQADGMHGADAARGPAACRPDPGASHWPLRAPAEAVQCAHLSLSCQWHPTQQAWTRSAVHSSCMCPLSRRLLQ